MYPIPVFLSCSFEEIVIIKRIGLTLGVLKISIKFICTFFYFRRTSFREMTDDSSVPCGK